ncbi:hypothetical protein JDFR1000234_33 [uncultured archaeal virus]|uniref:Uncharacterized protein n=1 Tax=uncultured archaeal virus TaxID=1960247 RepID=A0A1S5Y320_9VIRU|nr:hypothetical protein JDFR1000234_33 [uncultured archaeal virus]
MVIGLSLGVDVKGINEYFDELENPKKRLRRLLREFRVIFTDLMPFIENYLKDVFHYNDNIEAIRVKDNVIKVFVKIGIYEIKIKELIKYVENHKTKFQKV